MSEFDEKLNALLSDPSAMSQIMQLAQSLGGAQEPSPRNYRPGSDQSASPPVSHAPSQPADPLSSLLGDPSLLLKLMPLIQELNGRKDSNAKALLYALQPYLNPSRKDKIERALQLARLFHFGKRFLAEWEG